jgi:hypothetical protein
VRKVALAAVLGALVTALATGSFAIARGGGGGGGSFDTKLTGWDEVPTQVRPGEGRFHARVVSVAGEPAIEYVLRYSGLEGDAAQAHIHVGDSHENGGVAAFLCGPQASSDKPACPPRAGEVRGVIDRADVVGPAGQGVAAGEIQDLIRAMKRGEAYVNLHTSVATGGELRGDLRSHGGHGR